MSLYSDFSITINNPSSELINKLERARRVGLFKEFDVKLGEGDEANYSISGFVGFYTVQFFPPVLVTASIGLVDAIYCDYPNAEVTATAVWEDGYVSEFYEGDWQS